MIVREPHAHGRGGAASSTIRLIWGDGGYPGWLLGWAKSVLALQVEIIRWVTGVSGFHVCPRVWVVERTFAWINKYRRCVRAYATRPDHYEAVIRIVMTGLMIRCLRGYDQFLDAR